AFFFQAEDGIRDRNVTGVQTCALPIFASAGPAISAYRGRVHEVLEGELERLDSRGQRSPEVERALRHFAGVLVHGPTTRSRALRSEERRVGKECRARWTPAQRKATSPK